MGKINREINSSFFLSLFRFERIFRQLSVEYFSRWIVFRIARIRKKGICRRVEGGNALYFRKIRFFLAIIRWNVRDACLVPQNLCENSWLRKEGGERGMDIGNI